MLGAAYQAKHGLFAGRTTFSKMTASLPEPELACQPFSDAAEVYGPMLQRYRGIIQELVKSC